MKQSMKLAAAMSLLLMLGSCGTEPIETNQETPATTTLATQKTALATEAVITNETIHTQAVTVLSTEQTVFEPVNSDEYAVRIGTTTTAAEFCYAPHGEIIADLMPDTELRILAVSSIRYTPDDTSVWYLTEYDGEFGYIETSTVNLTQETAEPETKELVAIAQMFYVDAFHAIYNHFIPCFSYDPANIVTTNIPGEQFVVLNGIQSEDDIYTTIHRFFADTAEIENEIQPMINAELYANFDDAWAVSSFLFNTAEDPVDALYATRHHTVNLKIDEQTEQEIHFSGNIIWNQTSAEYGLQDNHTTIEDFSLIFENGNWKIGSFK